MRYTYDTKDTCSTQIAFDMDEAGSVTNVDFTGGCNGNLKAISLLVDGMDAAAIRTKCKHIHCGRRPTSCADQLALAIEKAQKEQKNA